MGGVGPHAGIDLASKLLDQTAASKDQEHLPLMLFSLPGQVADRTGFLLHGSGVNPAYGLYDILRKMEQVGVDIAGIACNTAHAPSIFCKLMNLLEQGGCRVRLLHMVEEVAAFVRLRLPAVYRVGVLSTVAAAQSGMYTTALRARGLETIMPSSSCRSRIDHAIYDLSIGLKACPRPPTMAAVQNVQAGVNELIGRQAEALILGCTELPLALPALRLQGRPVIDSSLVLARALVREAAPDKLVQMPDLNWTSRGIGTNGQYDTV